MAVIGCASSLVSTAKSDFASDFCQHYVPIPLVFIKTNIML